MGMQPMERISDIMQQYDVLILSTTTIRRNTWLLSRTISIIGTLILCIALVGNSFEVLSVTAFRIIIAFGILIQIISLICSVKKREF